MSYLKHLVLMPALNSKQLSEAEEPRLCLCAQGGGGFSMHSVHTCCMVHYTEAILIASTQDGSTLFQVTSLCTCSRGLLHTKRMAVWEGIP